jgi:outer membrane immunogenic protein
MKKLLLAAAVAALSSTSVFAADLAARPYTKAPAYVAPIYNWTGFYIGAQVGGAFQGSSGYNATTGVVGARDDSSFIGGGVVGYNYQFAPNWVLGLEGEFNGLSNNRHTFVDATPDTISLKNDWLASVTGRLGYTWGVGMIYAKGGVAFRDNGGIASTSAFATNRDDTGYTVGAGLEYMFAPAWSAKVEYQYYNFGRTEVAFGAGSAANYRDDLHTVKAGINYHFNWGGPVVAKY